jgi:hypothetical protein
MAENPWVRGWGLVTFRRHAKKAQRRVYSRGNGSQQATLGYITETQGKALDLIFEIQNGYSLGVWKTSNPLSVPTAQNNNTNWTATGMSRTWGMYKGFSAHFQSTRHAMYCTYNVTLKRVRVTIFAVENEYIFLSLCLQPYLSSMQCACAVLYCHLCPVPLYHMFPPILSHKRNN